MHWSYSRIVVLNDQPHRPDCSQILIHTVGADVVRELGERGSPLEPVKSTPTCQITVRSLLRGRQGHPRLMSRKHTLTADTKHSSLSPLLKICQAQQANRYFPRQLNNYSLSLKQPAIPNFLDVLNHRLLYL